MSNKQIIIVGGTSGIGRSLLNSIQKDNQVTVISRSRGSIPKEVSHIPFDVTSSDNINIPINTLDGLVYTPGTINLKPFNSFKIIDFQHDLEVNLLGAIRVIQHFLPALKKSENSSIVLYSTVAVATGMPFHSAVSVAKGAVEGLTKALAAEFAPKIRVNCVAPSIIDTPLAERFLNSNEKMEAAAKRHPLNRVGRSEDIAEITKFLLSEQSSWITGQVIGVDGGLSSIRTLK